MQQSSPECRLTIGGRPTTLRIDVERVRERLQALGHSGVIEVQLTTGLAPGEYFQELNDDGTPKGDVVCVNARMIVLQRLGLIPLVWPSAWCSPDFLRRRLLQTLAHELRHALQTAGATPLDPNAQPKIGYITLQWIGRGYILLALIGILAIRYFVDHDGALPIIAGIGGVLAVLAIVYLVLAYINYHLDPAEVDARAYERSSYTEWDDCISLG